MRYLGLDLSTVSTGYAIFEDDELKESGKIAPPSSLDTMDRIVYTILKIQKVIDNIFPDKILIEDTYYGSNYEVTKVLNRLAGGVVFMILTHKNRDLKVITNENFVTFVKPSSARKYFGLLPKTTKRLIVEAVNLKLGLELKLKDNDISDAIVTGYYGWIKDHEPNEEFKKESQKFFKTKVRGLKTPTMKGLKDGTSKKRKQS